MFYFLSSPTTLLKIKRNFYLEIKIFKVRKNIWLEVSQVFYNKK